MTTWDNLVADGHISSGVLIAGLTTYKVGGPARWFCEAGSLPILRDVTRAATERGVEVLVLGRGSNLLVSDAGYDGLVLRLGGDFGSIDVDGGAGAVTAGGGVPLPLLARRVAREGLGGLEFFVGIPGSVGGAVAMNAGFYGSETADVLSGARIMDTASGEVTDRAGAELGFGYRASNVGSGDLVLAASFRVRPRPVERISDRMREAIRWRRDNQPGGTLNAGSVFRNPPGDAAGRLIDSLGLKGLRYGGVRVSHRHANFFVADRGARAQDVFELVHSVRRAVRERTGIVLEPEVRFAGRFRPVAGTDR